MAVYDPDEVVIPNKLWMGDVRDLSKPCKLVIKIIARHVLSYMCNGICY